MNLKNVLFQHVVQDRSHIVRMLVTILFFSVDKSEIILVKKKIKIREMLWLS